MSRSKECDQITDDLLHQAPVQAKQRLQKNVSIDIGRSETIMDAEQGKPKFNGEQELKHGPRVSLYCAKSENARVMVYYCKYNADGRCTVPSLEREIAEQEYNELN